MYLNITWNAYIRIYVKQTKETLGKPSAKLRDGWFLNRDFKNCRCTALNYFFPKGL